MPLRLYGIAWAIAWCCTAALCMTAAVYDLRDVCEKTPASTPLHDVVIGSSLTEYAFGTNGFAGSPVEVPNLFVWAAPNISIEKSLYAIDCAFSLGARRVFLEANTFIFVSSRKGAYQAGVGRYVLSGIEDKVSHLTEVTRQIISDLAFRRGFFRTAYPSNPGPIATEQWDGAAEELNFLVMGFVDHLDVARLADRAVRHPGAIFLFEPPRTAVQVDHIEDQLSADLPAIIQDLAQVTDIPLLAVWPVWTDASFYDAASHLNATGSVTFITEFDTLLRRLEHAP